MEAQVFQALLEFVYTDALPQDMTREEEAVICQHLLVAADRYSMERLKLVCEDRLCRHINVASVATALALAEQHRCHGLKEACLQFLESPPVLNAVAAAEGFDHLANTCPSVLKDLIFKLTDCRLDLWGKH
jgi:speckle-type POZ protein